ncbi:hypothetical protein [Vibrio splendidus]|uniref:hypothetical protein n=1 Tax=Vibrio splendidus TaxID=29497 RepID=UPI0021B422A7|nr:hypothetical protein [Vibrio splendidus]UWZ96642.1 hypothetical protein IM698_09450 [Vibrio splendidus]
MKKTQMLPLAAIILGLLVGCGGGGGGGGGKPAKSYTFEFVQMEVNKSTAECTNTTSPAIFKSYSDGNFDYAKIATTVYDIHSYNANGSFNKSLKDKLSNGKLTFTENDVEDGGFVTVIDSVSFAGTEFAHTLSIQKELLGDYLINIEATQGTAACYTSNKLGRVSEDKAVALVSSNSIASYSVETYWTGKKVGNSVIAGLNIIDSNEDVLGAGYDNNGSIVEFALMKGSDLSTDDGSVPSSILLQELTDDVALSWNSESTLSSESAVVSANSNSTRFIWQNLSVSDSILNYSNDFTYSILTSAEHDEGWSIEKNQYSPSISNIIDIDFVDAVISNSNPRLNCTGNNCIVSSYGAVTVDDETIVRINVPVGSVAKHAIYANPSQSTSNISIPEYDGISTDASPADGNTIEVTYLSLDSVTPEGFELLANEYSNPQSSDKFVDRVSLISPPSTTRSSVLDKSELNYQKVEKDIPAS